MHLELYLSGFAAALLASELAARYAERVARARPPEAPVELPPVSLIIPVHGASPDGETALRAWLNQDYPGELQVVFAGQDPEDPALDLARRLAEDPGLRPFEVVVGDVPPGATAKVANLRRGLARCRHDLLVFSDDDILAPRDTLARIGAHVAGGAGAACCLIRHIGGENLWARRYAAFWNFFIYNLAGYTLAEGAAWSFTGGVMAFRRGVLEDLGGLEAVQRFVAEDIELGRRLEAGGVERRLAGVVASRVREMTPSQLYQKLRRSHLAMRQYPGWPLGALAALAATGGYLAALLVTASGHRPDWVAPLALFVAFRAAFSGLAGWRESGRFRPSLEFLLGDLVYVAAGVDALLRPVVRWGDRTYEVGPGGEVR